MEGKVAYLKDLTDNDLREIIPESEVIALLGAGISLWDPTNLPTGGQFTEAIYRSIFQDDCGRPVVSDDYLLRSLYQNLPFEIINERCPEEESILELLGNIFAIYRPNPIHELFAELMKSKVIQSIITPNYDCSLDQAIADVCEEVIGRNMGQIKRIVTKTDITNANAFSDQIFFKIHGSADDPTKKSLVFRLHQEGILNPWKRRLFRQLVHGRILLVVGYSGSDFDICPEIPLAMPKKIIWNFPSWDEDSEPANPINVSNKVNTIFLIGDMKELLSRMFRPVSVEIGQTFIDLENKFRGSFTPMSRRLWRIRILNSLTYNLYALRETSLLLMGGSYDVEFDIQLLSEHAGASASYGNYKDAARSHENAARLARINSLPNEQTFNQILFASDAWRCYGSFFKAILRHLEVKRGINSFDDISTSLTAAVLRNDILLSLQFYEAFKGIHLNFLARWVQQRASIMISKASKLLRDEGEWYPLQQLRLWSERFHLPAVITHVDQEYETPPSLQGYTMLNFPMGRMMAFRHGIRNQDISASKESGQHARELAIEAEKLGIRPEVWKLHLLILRIFSDERKIPEDFYRFWKSFWECQYSLPYRVWQIITGG